MPGKAEARRLRLQRFYDPQQLQSLREKIEKEFNIQLVNISGKHVGYAMVKRGWVVGWAAVRVLPFEIGPEERVEIDLDSFETGVTLYSYTGIPGQNRGCPFVVFVRTPKGDYHWKYDERRAKLVLSRITEPEEGSEIFQCVPAGHFEKF